MMHPAAGAILILNIACSNSFQRSGHNIRCPSHCRSDDGRCHRAHCHHSVSSRARRERLYNDMREYADEYLDGIGVGIDLGTTNSAVAMMLPAHDGKSSRTVPTMIEIGDSNKRTTIPSVVSFVPSNDADQPPWYSSLGTAGPPSDEVTWPQECCIYVGETAIEAENHSPRSTYRNVKRIIGTGGKMAELSTSLVPNLYISSSVDGSLENDEKKKKHKKRKQSWKRKKWIKRQSELPNLQRQLEDAIDDPALLSCQLGDAESTILWPEQISCMILRHLYDCAEKHHIEYTLKKGGNEDSGAEKVVKVTRAVIGVPAYFTEAQKRATIRASQMAGVDKVKLLPEPEAAALAYGSASVPSSDEESSVIDSEGELILVFDLGGGTFDVSILEVGGGITEVLVTVGNNRLGGTDFDRRVAEFLSGQAVEMGRQINNERKRQKKSLDFDVDGDLKVEGTKKDNPIQVKDWFNDGPGQVQDIILCVAEEVRKTLSNKKAVEVVLPFSQEGWTKLATRDGDDFSSFIIHDKATLANLGLENDDYTVVTLDRKTFEIICANELQLLLQPIREAAIMAGVLLPGDARPSFVESALAMSKEAGDGGEDFWDFDDDEETSGGGPVLVKANQGGVIDDNPPKDTLSDDALLQIQQMDLKAQKKTQQRGRRKARDVDKRERSYRKQKKSALDEATQASLLGKQPKKDRNGSGTPPIQSVSVGNERVQEGIHGRPLSRIVLVGGATRMPVIGKLLKAVVGMVPQRTVHPDEAVALGCAVQAGILDGENEGLIGGMSAVLSPMQAAVMRALAQKRGMEVNERGELTMDDEELVVGGISGMMVVDEFDDEDDFY